MLHCWEEQVWGGSVMVWGGIMGNRKTDLVVVQCNINAQRYVADLLNAYALPFIRQLGPGVTLMQDNARPHVARVTTQFLKQNNVNVMPWPAVSPDLNPIEHIWDQLGRRTRANHQSDDVRDLTRALQQEWRNLPNALYCVTLRRCGVGSLHAFVHMVATLGNNVNYWMCYISYWNSISKHSITPFWDFVIFEFDPYLSWPLISRKVNNIARCN